MPRRAAHHLTCLGVGDGHISARRGHSAYLYKFGAARLLVDCGEPATQTLLRAGARLEELDAVLVSHLHFDHVGVLFTLLQGLWLSRRQRPLTVYLPRAGVAPVRALMDAAHLFKAVPARFELRLEALQGEHPFPVGPVMVTPLPNRHLIPSAAPARARSAAPDEAFSFLLEDRIRRVGHSADLGDLDDLTALVQEPLDLLVCELAHLDPAALFARLYGHPIRRVALVHLSAPQWRTRQRWRARAARALAPILVCVPRDGERLAF